MTKNTGMDAQVDVLNPMDRQDAQFIGHQKSQSLPSIVFRMNSSGSANFDVNELEELDVKSARSLKLRLNAEESRITRSTSNVGQSGKFRLRDISPSRLRERHKGHARKKSEKEAKLTSSPRKNVRSSTTSWLPASFQQMFPSYRSRAEVFKKLFKDVPETERLITDYSCALQRDILVHGRLYVSQNWLCFYANIFGWETLVTINLRHVTSMTKEKTALVIPNAIQVWTESEKYFFTSFVSRDSTYRSLSRVWQNVLSEEPVCVPALMKAVGKYLDIDSEELETSSRGSNDELPSDFEDIVVDEELDNDSLVESEEPQSNDSPKEAKVEDEDKSVEESRNATGVPDIAVSPASPAEVKQRSPETAGMPNGTVTPSKSSGASDARRKFPFPFKKEFSPLMRRKKQPPVKTRSDRESFGDSVHRDSLIEEGSVSDSNEEDEVPLLCPCESHFNVECMNEEYATDVDTLFEHLFTDCDFYRGIRARRNDFNLDIEPWVEAEDKKLRSVKFTVNLNLTIGPKTSNIEEKQELLANKPGHFYVVESNIINEGVPYSDSFVIVQRFCLTRVNSFTCRLRVTATVKYLRPVWGFVKSMITKNAHDGLSSFFNFLKEYIRTTEDESVSKGRRRKSSPKKPSRTVPEKPEDVQCLEETGEAAAVPSVVAAGRLPTLSKQMWRDSSWFHSFFSILLILLVVLNLYLGYRVLSLERATRSWESVGLPPFPSNLPTDLEEFRNLLYKQQYIQNVQLKRWQHVLSTSVQFLQQVQDSLKELQQEVENPLNE